MFPVIGNKMLAKEPWGKLILPFLIISINLIFFEKMNLIANEFGVEKDDGNK